MGDRVGRCESRAARSANSNLCLLANIYILLRRRPTRRTPRPRREAPDDWSQPSSRAKTYGFYINQVRSAATLRWRDDAWIARGAWIIAKGRSNAYRNSLAGRTANTRPPNSITTPDVARVAPSVCGWGGGVGCVWGGRPRRRAISTAFPFSVPTQAPCDSRSPIRVEVSLNSPHLRLILW